MHKYKIFDAHCDTLCMLADNDGDIKINNYNLDIRRMLSYEQYTQIFACFIAPEHKDNAMDRFKRLADIYDSCDFDSVRHLLSVEGCEMVQSIEDVDYLKSRNVCCAALTWNFANKIAGGAEEPEQGLTQFGRDVVRRMNELGIIIDVSHLNDKSFYDVEKINTGTLIATHSNSRAVCRHYRNLTDDMFKIIRDTGGVVGINLYPPFVSDGECCRPGAVIKHIENFMSLSGELSIGIGADFDGVENNLPIGIKGCEDLYKLCDLLDKDIVDKITHENWERIFT